MSGFLYYCPKCTSLISDTYEDDPVSCENCYSAMIPLHVSEDEWGVMSDEDKGAILEKHRTPQIQPKRTARTSDEKGKTATMNNRVTNNPYATRYTLNNQQTNDVQSSPGKASKLSIIGFIFSFLGCISFVGIILGIVDLAKKDGRKKGLSVAAIIVGSVVLIASISAFSSNSNSKDTSNTTEIATTGVVEEDKAGETATVEDNNVEEKAEEQQIVSEISEEPVEEAEEVEPEEQEIPVVSKEDFIASCTDLGENYKAVARNPSDYIDQNFYLTCVVSSVREGGGFFSGYQKYYVTYEYNMDEAQKAVNDGWADSISDASMWGTNYDVCVWLFDNRNTSDPDYVKILEDDIIKVYGTFTGMTQKENSLTGETGEQMALEIKYVELLEE